MKNKITLFVGACLMSGLVASIVLSPNTNQQSGNIPAGHTQLDFNLYNGNWVQNLSLPSNANDQDTITIRSEAGYQSYLDTSNTDLPIESFTISNGQSFSFVFNKAQGKWLIQPLTSYPTNGVSNYIVPNSNASVLKVHVRDGQWAKQVTLPNTAVDGTLLNILSDAGYHSKIDTSNLLFASSFTLQKGSNFWFKYSKDLNQWVPERLSPLQLNVKNVGAKLSSIQAPLTEISFADANWVASLELPATAKDRDRVVVKSTATWQATISNTNINSKATLKLNKGDRYDFMYLKDQSKWELISAPQVTLQAKNISNQQLTEMKTPILKVQLGNANWQSSIALPFQAQQGDKVVVHSSADWESQITASNGLKQSIAKGESQRYIYTENGWVVDSYTIDMLLVNSPEVSKSIGANAAKIRMIEGLDLTNIAAENSNGQFYIRTVGYLEYRIPNSKTLNDITGVGRDDKIIQNERQRVSADAVYYQGNEDGCGLAWVNKTPSAYNMLGTGSTNCGITVMRHEFGHNMGLSHNDSADSARGFAHPLGSTIMGGNSLSFFSSPSLYHPKYGYRLGVSGQTDAVAMINKNAQAVSKFQ